MPKKAFTAIEGMPGIRLLACFVGFELHILDSKVYKVLILLAMPLGSMPLV